MSHFCASAIVFALGCLFITWVSLKLQERKLVREVENMLYEYSQ